MTCLKHCAQCGVQKETTEFHKDRSKADGLRTSCRACRNARQKVYREENPEKVKAAIAKCWAKSKDKYLSAIRAYSAANKEKIDAYQADYRRAKRTERRAASSAWQKENLDRCRELNAARAASKRQRTPVWADRKLVLLVYRWRSWLQDVAGIDCHVDHIVPLQGDSALNPGVKACGLHCAANLRVIPGTENSGKRNRVTGDEYLIPAEIDTVGFKDWASEWVGVRA